MRGYIWMADARIYLASLVVIFGINYLGRYTIWLQALNLINLGFCAQFIDTFFD